MEEGKMMKMDKFIELNENEIIDVNGGAVLEVILGIATILGGYAVVREVVKDKGRADAWNALKYNDSLEKSTSIVGDFASVC